MNPGTVGAHNRNFGPVNNDISSRYFHSKYYIRAGILNMNKYIIKTDTRCPHAYACQIADYSNVPNLTANARAIDSYTLSNYFCETHSTACNGSIVGHRHRIASNIVHPRHYLEKTWVRNGRRSAPCSQIVHRRYGVSIIPACLCHDSDFAEFLLIQRVMIVRDIGLAD